MERETLPRTVTCPKCANEVPLTIWAYAHWGERLTATCANGHRFGFFRGRALEGRRGPRRPK